MEPRREVDDVRRTRRSGLGLSLEVRPGTITSKIEQVGPPGFIAWTGKTVGIKAIHTWRLEPQDGSTLVRTEESYDGLVARLLRRPLQKTLDRALADGLRYLKAEVEAQAGTAPRA